MRSLLLFWAAVFLAGCSAETEPLYFSGSTMGTTYNVTVVARGDTPAPDNLGGLIEGWLETVNQHMSTYLPESALSELNRAPVGEWLAVSPMMLEVLRQAQSISQLSDGAFDITIGPLVDLWGFGPVETHNQVPDEAALTAVRQRVGFAHLRLRENPPALRKNRDVQLDLSAIAKGFAADYVGRELAALGLPDYLVEIGGDLVVNGHNARGKPWRIGVEKPSVGRDGVQQAVVVTGEGVATSGDYRNFFRQGGRSYSHILDPRLGRPVQRDLVSVTVIADSAALADGLATALTVLGSADALALAERHDLAVYLIVRRGDELIARYSSAFETYMSDF